MKVTEDMQELIDTAKADLPLPDIGKCSCGGELKATGEMILTGWHGYDCEKCRTAFEARVSVRRRPQACQPPPKSVPQSRFGRVSPKFVRNLITTAPFKGG